jgi:hypothetical protein
MEASTMQRRSLVVPAILSTLLVAISGRADEPSAADIAAARAIGAEGVKLADAGHCDEALDKLARSEAMYHSMVALVRLGECQVELGKLVDGTENLNKAVREPLPPGAPAAAVAAQERAKKTLDAAKPRVAKLKIAVSAPAGTPMMVKLDGQVVPVANLGMNRPTDPGAHTIEASAPGYLTATGKVTLAEGATDSIALTLEVDPNAPKEASPPSDKNASAHSSPQSVEAPPPGPEPNRLPAYVLLGVGGVGLVVGTIGGIVALGKKSDLDSACSGNKVCPTSAQGIRDSASSAGTVSTVGFVVGAIGLMAGATLYVLRWPVSSPDAGTSAAIYVTPGGGGVRGAF